ncbi:MAG: serine/threonine-protein kinase [Pseudomonadota bacterium]
MTQSIVGPYRLLRHVNSGGEGAVYVAEDTRLGRRVAAKLKPLPEDPLAQTQAVAEARALAALNDPLIVQIYDVLELEDQLAVVMEYVDGEDLARLITRERLSMPSALALGQDICHALTVAHDAGLLHGDLKPGNILVTPEARIKLTDFGLRGFSRSATSPEQRRGSTPDWRSDLFALGTVLHAVLLGPVPDAILAGADTTGVLTGHDALPDSLAALLESLLQGEPALRPASALAVRLELLALARAYPSGYADLLSAIERGDLPDTTLESARRAGVFHRLRWTQVAPAAGWMALGVGLTLLVAMLNQPAVDRLQLRLEAVHWVGQSPPLVHDVESLLREAVAAVPSVEIVSGQASQASLSLSVHCNLYSCISTVALKEEGSTLSDTRALLPDSDLAAWQQRLQQGVMIVMAQR